MERDSWNNYFIDGTNVLKNKLGITDNQLLSKEERILSLKKLTYLELFPLKGNFDGEHLKQIHKFLFDDIYPFAGVYRKCTMARFRDFVHPEEIEKDLNEKLSWMNEAILEVSSVDEYAFFLASAYYDLMSIHPFREGNGRSVREFLREFVLEKNKVLPFGVKLDFSKIDKQEFLEAVKYRYIYPSMLEMLFKEALVPVKVSQNPARKL